MGGRLCARSLVKSNREREGEADPEIQLQSVKSYSCVKIMLFGASRGFASREKFRGLSMELSNRYGGDLDTLDLRLLIYFKNSFF